MRAGSTTSFSNTAKCHDTPGNTKAHRRMRAGTSTASNKPQHATTYREHPKLTAAYVRAPQHTMPRHTGNTNAHRRMRAGPTQMLIGKKARKAAELIQNGTVSLTGACVRAPPRPSQTSRPAARGCPRSRRPESSPPWHTSWSNEMLAGWRTKLTDGREHTEDNAMSVEHGMARKRRLSAPNQPNTCQPAASPALT